MRILRCLAFATYGAGVVFFWRTVKATLAELSLEEIRMPLFTSVILVAAAALSVAIIYAALSYLRRPCRDRAIRLSLASATSVYFLWPGLAGAASGGFVVAFVVYRFALLPAINRVFRVDQITA